MTKLTKNQVAALLTIWTTKVTVGDVDPANRDHRIVACEGTLDEYGWVSLNPRTVASLVKKGLAQILVTKVQTPVMGGRYFLRQAVILTEAGRKAAKV